MVSRRGGGKKCEEKSFCRDSVVKDGRSFAEVTRNQFKANHETKVVYVAKSSLSYNVDAEDLSRY